MTVRDLREMLDKYSDETVLDARTRTVRGYGRYGYYGTERGRRILRFYCRLTRKNVDIVINKNYNANTCSLKLTNGTSLDERNPA